MDSFEAFIVEHPLAIIARFDPITLEEMDRVTLQDRADTKYIFAGSSLPTVLRAMLPQYRLLQVEAKRGTEYRSLYFDTTDLRNYQDHHNSRTFRSKVRFREYVGSGLVFLEVKRKTGNGRTIKSRLPVNGIRTTLSPEQELFVDNAIGNHERLSATLWNHFTRYTFVHRSRQERVTLDIDLRFATANREGSLGTSWWPN
jgi:hypothetical protein